MKKLKKKKKFLIKFPQKKKKIFFEIIKNSINLFPNIFVKKKEILELNFLRKKKKKFFEIIKNIIKLILDHF